MQGEINMPTGAPCALQINFINKNKILSISELVLRIYSFGLIKKMTNNGFSTLQ